MLMKKFIGKPYAGKSHVRIDEGAGKVDLPLPALLYRKSAGFPSASLRELLKFSVQTMQGGARGRFSDLLFMSPGVGKNGF